ncbi:J domain-containing protein [Niabella ginsengisoli]|uniref:J domain-containing protein n=1 Tax=Niabella ginsengisoli TaxID=522298 RepID=A0ABS9SM42_9BACT|nr:J domain-containing protein [Niabella ginsengisoli]MCH5599224.1 J domain-containing protein [Niabella ginsengisoli]
MQGTLKNYYEILGVPRSANADQIRTAYRKLLLKFHPDKNIGDVYFEDWSKKINEAFEVLMSSDLRSEYDKVYEETKEAWKQAAQTAKQEAEGDVQKDGASEVLSVDTEIKKLAPVYISAKQAHIKASRNVSDIELRLTSKRKNVKWRIVISSGIILATLVWAGISNWKVLSQWRRPQSLPIGVSAVSPLPPLSEMEDELHYHTEGNIVPVNLWLRITSAKAYFFEEPGQSTKTRFLSKGNKFHATKKYENYYYGVFQSSVNESYKIEGWIKREDVEILTNPTGADY